MAIIPFGGIWTVPLRGKASGERGFTRSETRQEFRWLAALNTMAKKKPTKPKPATSIAAVQAEKIEQLIHVIRGERVMLDTDLASLYGVEVKVLNQQVRRNQDRFPADFMFQLTDEEWGALRSQFVTLNAGRGRHRKYSP